jgi:hypothetical protein
MSVLKTVGVVGTISGIGLIGYYLLNKYKPNISKNQITELKIEKGQYVLKEDTETNRKINAILAQYGADNNLNGDKTVYPNLKTKILTQKPLILNWIEVGLLNYASNNLNEKSNGNANIGTPLYAILGEEYLKIAPSKYEFIPRTDQQVITEVFLGNVHDYKPFEKTNFLEGFGGVSDSEYFEFTPYVSEAIPYIENFNSSGKGLRIVANNCIELDVAIKKITDRIAEQTRTQPDDRRRRVLVYIKSILEDYFALHSCRDKIEKQRLLDIAKTTTLGAISTENSVLGKSQKDQNIYLGIGALVLVLSTGILLNSSKSSTVVKSSGSSSVSSSGIFTDLIIFGGLASMGYLIFKKPKVIIPNK